MLYADVDIKPFIRKVKVKVRVYKSIKQSYVLFIACVLSFAINIIIQVEKKVVSLLILDNKSVKEID